MLVMNTRIYPPPITTMVAVNFTPPLCFSPQKQKHKQTLVKASLHVIDNGNKMDTELKTLTLKHPIANHHEYLSIQFQEIITFLEILGIDSRKAFRVNPDLYSASISSIQSITTFLEFNGILPEDFPRILGTSPKILTADINNDLIPVFDFLSDHLNIPHHKYRKVINKCPRLLASSVENQLKPALCYLQRLGFRDVRALAYQDGGLLVSNVETTLMPKIDYFVSLGFLRDEAVTMVLRCPRLLSYSIDNIYKPKFDYFDKEMARELNELKEFPQYFCFGLDQRIKPRHLQSEEYGVKLPLQLLLKTTDEDFAKLLTSRNVNSGSLSRIFPSFEMAHWQSWHGWKLSF